MNKTGTSSIKSTGQCRSISFREATLCYWAYGRSKKALVFIHGWACDSSLWRLQAPLHRKYCSLLIDLPGHGNSDAPEWDYTVELFAHAVALVLKQEEIEKAVLVGHSLGGPVSTMLLRLFPDTVSAIIYVDSFFNLPDYYLTRSQRQELGERLSDNSKFEALIRTVIGTRATDEQRNEILEVMRNTPKHVRVNARTTNSQPAAMSEDQIYPIPALLLVTPRYADIDKDWIRHIPRLEVKLWEGHGHFPFLEDHVRFNHEVETFLQQHQLMQ